MIYADILGGFHAKYYEVFLPSPPAVALWAPPTTEARVPHTECGGWSEFCISSQATRWHYARRLELLVVESAIKLQPIYANPLGLSRLCCQNLSDDQHWFGIACLCIANLNFLGDLSSKYYSGPTLLRVVQEPQNHNTGRGGVLASFHAISQAKIMWGYFPILELQAPMALSSSTYIRAWFPAS